MGLGASGSQLRESVVVVRLIIGLLGGVGCVVPHGEAASVPVVPDGFEVSLYASGELLSNPVAITFDRDERLYVAEARRKETGVWGVTFSRWWAMEDYQGGTMAARRAMYRRWSHLVPRSMLERESEIVRVISDRDGDGRAEHAAVFADHFNHPLDGNAAGVLAIEGSVYLACIPHLWRLEDRDGDLSAEVRQSLHSGFGVRVGVHGHDLHGLIQGPDGKLYFTVGDRGFDVTGQEGRRFHQSHCGAVFRCFPDGSGLEVVHTGLRNPQELAFNDRGDLFTVDNNMSGGDECRLLHLLEGADSGWDATFQLSGHFREETGRRDHPKPTWFTERLWAPADSQVPHWHHAAVANLSRGPSGLSCYPGAGLPSIDANTFFLADFVGTPATSEVLTFRLEPEGASYRLVEQSKFVERALITDIEFGPDGALYLADWIHGWSGTGSGRIWRVTPKTPDDQGAEVRRLLKAGFRGRPAGDLAEDLGHPDRRVRYQAQFELVRRGPEGEKVFAETLEREGGRHACIHALWGLGQLAEKKRIGKVGTAACLNAFLAEEPEVRAQAAKVSRWLSGGGRLTARLVGCLQHSNPRVVYHALQSLTHLGETTARDEVLDRLRSPLGKDRAIRHAAVLYLAHCCSEAALGAMLADPSRDVRLGAVLALRRIRSQLLAGALLDEDRDIRFAALRAIHDLPIRQQLAGVAELVSSPDWIGPEAPFPVAQRILNANFRLGQRIHAARLAGLALDDGLPRSVRREALVALKEWNDPSVFDRVTWNLRPLESGRVRGIGAAIQGPLRRLHRGLLAERKRNEDSSRNELLQLVSEVLIEHGLLTHAVARDGLRESGLPVAIRFSLMRYLIEERTLSPELAAWVMQTAEPTLAAHAAGFLVDRDDVRGWRFFQQAFEGSDLERSKLLLPEVIDLLATRDGVQASRLLALGLEQAGGLGADAWLNLVEAVESRGALAGALSDFLESLGETPQLVRRMLLTEGGDAERGKEIFRHHAAQCQRCHRVEGNGGLAGPDLSQIGKTLTRDQLVEALLEPGKRIAPGYGRSTIDLKNGDVVTGVILREDGEDLTLLLQEGMELVVAKERIEYRSGIQSSMPAMGEVMSRREMRDLIAYLASLR